MTATIATIMMVVKRKPSVTITANTASSDDAAGGGD